VGQGSTFTFTVRAKRKDVFAQNIPEQGNKSRAPLASLRILVAEDNKVNQAVVSRLLERAGHTVAIAANGEEATAMYGASDFDLVLMDVHMPVLDGFGATARIRQMERSRGTHTPLIALTANAMSGDRERCLSAGMDGYISKPVSRDELLDTIAQFASNRFLTIP